MIFPKIKFQSKFEPNNSINQSKIVNSVWADGLTKSRMNIVWTGLSAGLFAGLFSLDMRYEMRKEKGKISGSQIRMKFKSHWEFSEVKFKNSKSNL